MLAPNGIVLEVVQSTCRQEDVTQIHEHENCAPNASKVADIARNDENDRDDVVSKHLEIVLPASLDVDKDDLVYPERELEQVVPFDWSGKVSMWIIDPEVRRMNE